MGSRRVLNVIPSNNNRTLLYCYNHLLVETYMTRLQILKKAIAPYSVGDL
jgi:hypothetical protein